MYGPAVDPILADEAVESLTSPGEILWPLADHLGTPRDLAEYNTATSETTVASHRVYDSFGNLVSESNGAVEHLFGFTGVLYEVATGLNYHRARWLDPATSRWLSEDPIGFAAGDTNLGRYVGNNAISVADPSGLDPAIFYPTAPPGLQQSPEYQEGYRQGMRKGFFSGLIVIGFLSNPWDEVADRIIEHFTGWPFGFPTPSDLADIPRKGLEKVGRDAVEKGAREGAETVTEKCPVTLKHFLEGDDVAEAGRHAQDVGEVTGIVDRAGKDARRAANLKGKPKVPGKDLDEYPPAVIKPDDPSVTSVRPIDRSHNRRSGARLRSELPPDGTRVRIIPPAKSS